MLSIAHIKSLLEEAADTLKRMPADKVNNRLTFWPEVVRSSAEIFMMQKYARNTMGAATPDAISRMDRMLIWLLPLEHEERRIVWARACGTPWRRLEDIDGRSHVTLRKIQGKALEKIKCTIEQEGIPADALRIPK